MKHFFVFIICIAFCISSSAQLIINELSQGPSGTKEYVELLVTGNPVCNHANTVDLRGWIIDDNNSWHGSGTGTGIAAGHVRFANISLWASVKIGTLILIYNDADTSSAVAALTIDTSDANSDCVFIVPVSSTVLDKNSTLPLSNGSMTTYNVGGLVYNSTGNWSVLGMANFADAFHTVSPLDYASPYHSIGWGGDTALVNIYYPGAQGGRVIYMANTVSNDPFDPMNFIDTSALTHETPGAPNNVANGAWITSLNNNCQPFISPVVSITASGVLSCSQSSIVLTASSSGNVNYQWSNGAITANDTITSAGVYYLTVSDAAGVCSVLDSITIISSGSVSISVSGVNTTCGLSNGSATVTITSGSAQSFSWSNGGTTDSISNLAAGTYLVTVDAGGGCIAIDSVTILPSGNAPVTIVADRDTICSGDTANICAPIGYADYHWNLGPNTQCIPATLAGNYYVTVTDIAGCTATSNPLPLHILQLPPVSVSVNGDTLNAYNAVSYQWYLNGAAIAGATSSAYIATQSGSYTVQVTDINGCRAVSSSVGIITGINELTSAKDLIVYPNPASSDEWIVRVSDAFLGHQLHLFDASGRLIYSLLLTENVASIPLPTTPGFYLLKVASNTKAVIQKLSRL